ncbi:hypothetical protein ACH5WX_03015, partial [Nocardioides sp. CER28]
RKQANAAHAAHDLRTRAEAMARTAAATAKSAHVLRGEAEAAAQKQALLAQQSAEAAQAALKQVEEQAEAARVAHETAEQAHESRAAALADAHKAAGKVMEALNARLEAEEAAILAQAARDAAEQAAKSQAERTRESEQLREEAERRTQELLAQLDAARAETAEAHRLRAEAEEAAAQRAIDRQAVESSIRHNTELVETALQERLAAERRLADLAAELVALRGAVTNALREKGSKRSLATLQEAAATHSALDREAARALDETGSIPVVPSAFEPVQVDDGAPPPGAGETQQAWLRNEWARVESRRAGEPGAAAEPEPAQPTRQVDVRSFGAAGGAGDVTVTDDGVLDVRQGGRSESFDLYDRDTALRIIGRPGQRRWRVELSRPGAAPVVLDGKQVDAEALTRELLRWRPEVARR